MQYRVSRKHNCLSDSLDENNTATKTQAISISGSSKSLLYEIRETLEETEPVRHQSPQEKIHNLSNSNLDINVAEFVKSITSSNIKKSNLSDENCERKTVKYSNKRVQKSSLKSQAKANVNTEGEPRAIRRRNRKKREITDCPHTYKEHYAKGMCNLCYHIHGRKHMASHCEHTNLKSYAKGKCIKCYFTDYYQTSASANGNRGCSLKKEKNTP